MYVDDDLVSKSSLHDWEGPLVVDANRGSLEGAIGIRGDPGDVEIVDDSTCLYGCGQQ